MKYHVKGSLSQGPLGEWQGREWQGFKTRGQKGKGFNAMPTLLALAVSQALFSAHSEAATINVDDGGDVTATDSVCTFREAINSFNSGSITLLSGCENFSTDPFGTNDTVTFSTASVSLTQNTARGQIEIDANLTIQGSGVTIQGDNSDRLMYINPLLEVSIDNTTLTGGSASAGSSALLGYGGAVLVPFGSTLTVSNSTVSGNTAERGGGLRGSYADLRVINSTITNNSALQRGGGIELRGNANYGSLSITGGTITNNSAYQTGGGVTLIGITAADYPTGTISGATVSSNTAGNFGDGAGGGIFVSRAWLTIDSATMVSNNRADYGGAGMEIENGILFIYDSSVQGNQTLGPGFGGGGILIDRATLKMESTTVSQNSAAFGGGIYVTNPQGGSFSITLENSSISDNRANYAGGGGGILVRRDNSLVLTNTEVNGNIAKGAGGGIFVRGVQMHMYGGSVSNNTSDINSISETGGGIYAGAYMGLPSTLYIEDATISGNSSLDGGGLRIAGSYVHFETGTVSNNQARFGAGVLLQDGAYFISTQSTISTNLSSNSGAGFHTTNSNLVLNNSTISNNTATFDAGGIQSIASAVALNNSTLTDNLATFEFSNGGGIWANFGSGATTLYLHNSMIAGNRAGDHHELYLINPVLTNSSNVIGDSANTSAGAFMGFTPDPTDIIGTSDGGSPVLLNQLRLPLADNGGPTQTVGLPANSPAVDAGDAGICASLAVNNVDQRGETRPDGAACDIGAFEGTIDTSNPFVIPLPNGKAVIIDL